MIIVSACLAGIDCAHNGSSHLKRKIRKMVESGVALPACPEELGGLKTPRNRSEIIGGDGRDVLRGEAVVLTSSREDVTENFLRGARKTLALATRHKVTEAILKSNSPSCGCGRIYDGTFTKTLKRGCGVTAGLLIENGITVKTEKDI